MGAAAQRAGAQVAQQPGGGRGVLELAEHEHVDRVRGELRARGRGAVGGVDGVPVGVQLRCERVAAVVVGERDQDRLGMQLRARNRPTLGSIGLFTLLAQLLVDAMGAFASKPLPPGVTERYARQRLLEFKRAAADAMLDERRHRGSADVVLDRDAIFDELADILVATCRDQLRFTWHDDGQTATVRLHDKALLIVERSTDDRAPDTVSWWLWGIGPDGRSGPGPEWPQSLDVDVGVDAEREHVKRAARHTDRPPHRNRQDQGHRTVRPRRHRRPTTGHRPLAQAGAQRPRVVGRTESGGRGERIVLDVAARRAGSTGVSHGC
jgi:hypothetical protein